ncbi:MULTISPECIES: TenA family protein [Micrococcaceae]|uniref:TenA family protein n=1 Tax=unclassified Kocuria TaxID=2649579 RepID=UPI001EDFED0F|nr:MULTISPECIES: TenA family protein [unclassified Kocuria]
MNPHRNSAGRPHIQAVESVIPMPEDTPVGRLRHGPSAGFWEAAVDHRFVRELFSGTIADEVLAEYLKQDYQFFDEFISMVGACVAHADTIGAKLRFSRQLGMLASDEDGYFIRSFDELGVPEKERLDPELNAPASSFKDLMRGAVRSASYAELLVMLVVAECLYLDWGERDLTMPESQLHRGWIELHRGQAFREWCQFLVDELNRAASQTSVDTVALNERWTAAVRLEKEFFDAAYTETATG